MAWPRPASWTEPAAILAAPEQALLVGKIATYAQGFVVLTAASEAWNWNLPMGTIAKIWRAGCIIRSVFLDDIAQGLGQGRDQRTCQRWHLLAVYCHKGPGMTSTGQT